MKELRLKLLKFPVDVLTYYAVTMMDALSFSRYPASGNDKSAKVQSLIDWSNRRNKLPELMAFADEFHRRLRRLLVEGMSEPDLYTFLYDTPSFHQLGITLGGGKGKAAYINILIEECDRYPNKYDEVFEWAKELNPNKYTSILMEV